MIRNLGICLTLAALLGIGVATAHARQTSESLVGLNCTTICNGNICHTYCY